MSKPKQIIDLGDTDKSYGGFKGTYTFLSLFFTCDLAATFLLLSCDLAATFLLLSCDLAATLDLLRTKSTSNEGSFRLDLCREVVVVRWVTTSLAPAVIKTIWIYMFKPDRVLEGQSGLPRDFELHLMFCSFVCFFLFVVYMFFPRFLFIFLFDFARRQK